ncbi:Eco57I restriction-modification methylase domain-containing protein [Alkalihalobacillus sp. R86527]|uniref:Eco57I restriction-modification methylase domain-containing protein n=1 Tax=Alkalihalobacillus sp. R86527 TaxID=3093863 RepID=UPI00366D1426
MTLTEEEIKSEIKRNLSELIREYKMHKLTNDHENITEETIRGYLNKMLEFFGWNVLNTNEVIQEKRLSGKYKEKLSEIESTHSKPDYQLLKGRAIQAFVDAKDLKVDITNDSSVAYQIRSYGWSAQVPCSFVSNFEQFGIFNTKFEPDPTFGANYGAGTLFLEIDEYIEKFDVLYDHLYRGNVYEGKLLELFDALEEQGEDTLDARFMRIISNFRLVLAENLLGNNPELDIEGYSDLNFFVQVIMNRIMFLRVCESRGIEKDGLLKEFQENGFWNDFKNYCYNNSFDHYDGALFDRDTTFYNLKLDDVAFEKFIKNIYYPSPFRFDVIPVTLIAEIYEYFLAKKIEKVDGKVVESLKGIYQKTQGGISTPKHIVEFISEKTITPENCKSVNDILKLKILEPACGSGVFLVAAYEIIEKRLKELYTSGLVEPEYKEWFIEVEDNVYLTVNAKKSIMNSCLYGIDIDETAIEVTKLSLALKVIDNNHPVVLNEVGIFDQRILQGIHQNLKNGNTLVETDFLNCEDVPDSEIYSANPFDLKLEFAEVMELGGFTHIIGNPPYVEPKHYTKLYPNIYEYIKNKHQAATGKGDISIYFIKRCIELLGEGGKLGFITQKRFFKTEYGKTIRDILSNNSYLEEIYDFKSTNLFKGRITYVAFLLISKTQNSEVSYFNILPTRPESVRNVIENREFTNEETVRRIEIPSNQLINKTWSFDIFAASRTIERLKGLGISSFGSYDWIKFKTGVQVLWNTIYRIENCTVENNIVTGVNKFGEEVSIELEVAKKLIVNERFYCFKGAETATYILFPYRGLDNNELIPLSQMESDFPLAYHYLLQNEERIKEKVNFNAKEEEWHGFTRVQGHSLYNQPKILLPMTAKETTASYVTRQGVFADNANMYQIVVEEHSEEFSKVLTTIINSSVFSFFAKIEANPQQNENYKFTRQFLSPVLFPYSNLMRNEALFMELLRLYNIIIERQEAFLTSRGSQKMIITHLLNRAWNRVDEITKLLYCLNDEEIRLIDQYRRNDRVNIIY